MKIESIKKIMVILVVLSFALLSNPSAGSEIPGGIERSQAFKFSKENNLDYSSDNQFAISLTRLASKTLTNGDVNDLIDLQGRLDGMNIQSLSLEQYKQVLFLQAEIDFKLQKYTEAFHRYFQLKLLIKETTDPMLQEISERLNEAQKKAESARKRTLLREKLKSIEKGEFGFLIVPLVLLLLLLFTGKLFADWNRRKYSDFRKADQFFCAPIETHLIQFDQMRKQDGRVSEKATNNYTHKDDISISADVYDKRNATARLIVEGYEMIVRVNNLAPYPIAVVSKIFKKTKLQTFWQYTVIGFLLICLQAAVRCFFSEDYYISERLVGLFLVAALIISSLTCLRIMARATINALDEVVSMLEVSKKNDSIDQTPESVLRIEKSIDFLFRSPWQFFIVIVIFFIVIGKIAIKGGNFTPDRLIFFAFVLILLLIACPIIWLLIGSIYVLNDICHMEDLAVNPLSPLKTMGLVKWTSVIGTYGLSSSIVLSFGCSIPVITGFINKDAVGGWFWYIIIMPLLFFYWIYPYHKISNMVKQQKTRRMQLIKTKILHIFNEWIAFEEKELETLRECREKHSEDECEKLLGYREKMMDKLKPYLEPMNKYYEIFKIIDESPQSNINFSSILELGRAMGIPSLFAILSALLLN